MQVVRIPIVDLLPGRRMTRHQRVITRGQGQVGAATKAIVTTAKVLAQATVDSEWIRSERMQGAPGRTRVSGLVAIEIVAAFKLGTCQAWFEQFDGVTQAREANRIGAACVFEFATPAGVVAVVKRDAAEMHIRPEVGAAQQQDSFELAAGFCLPAELVREPATRRVSVGAGELKDAAQRLHGPEQ